jgi:tetratricopeptide (TPR) repeat protein
MIVKNFSAPLILALALTLLPGTAATAQGSPYFSIAPTSVLPLGTNSDLYAFGVGLNAAGHFPIGDAGLEATAGIDYQNAFLSSGAGGLNIIRVLGGANWDFLRRDALSVGLWARAGAFLGFFGSGSPMVNPTASAGLRVGFKVSESVSVALEPGWDQYLAMSSGSLVSFFSGAGAAVRVSIEPAKSAGGERRPKLRIEAPVFKPVFPVIYKHYDKNPLGTVKIINGESASISGVEVKFLVPSYMEGATVIATPGTMKRGESIEIPITALFSNDVLKITEADTVQARIMVTYAVGGAALNADRTASLNIYSRNTITWSDDRRAAAFVTANDPTIKKFASNSVAAISSSLVNPFTDSMRSALAVFTALQQYDVRYKVDPASSYLELSKSGDSPDYLQFPVQTLDYRTGDCDDLSILYSAMLEAVGVEAAFITVPGHIYTAFKFAEDAGAVKKLISSGGDVILPASGGAWIPVETTMLDKGFLAAWAAGAKEWREAASSAKAALIPIREAWQVYASTWFGSEEQNDIVEKFPKAADISKKYAITLRQLMERELANAVDDIEKKLKENPSASLLNQLGATYARFGILDKAETQFKKAADQNFPLAMLNLGNVYFLKGDYKAAAAQYEHARALKPDNALVTIALARVRYELEDWPKAKQLFNEAKTIDPRVADQYAYLGGASAESARAVDIKQRQEVSWDLWGE